MTNYEYDALEAEARRVSLREQKATVMELMIAVEDAADEGKNEYTAREVTDFLFAFIRNKMAL